MKWMKWADVSWIAFGWVLCSLLANLYFSTFPTVITLLNFSVSNPMLVSMTMATFVVLGLLLIDGLSFVARKRASYTHNRTREVSQR